MGSIGEYRGTDCLKEFHIDSCISGRGERGEG